MKKSTVILICLLVFVLAVALGYAVGLRKGVHNAYLQVTSDYLRDSQSHSMLVARTYLDCLQAMDTGRPDDAMSLRRRALNHLKVYVSGAQDLHAQGYTWGSINEEIYSNAVMYLAEHPPKK